MARRSLSVAKHEGEFRFLKPISRDAVPLRFRGGPTSVVVKTPFWPEVERVCREAAANGVAPFEEALELNLADFKDELKSLKNPTSSVLTHLKGLIKHHKLEKKVEVVQRQDRLYIVGPR